MNQEKDKGVIRALVGAGEREDAPQFPYSSAYELPELLGIFEKKPSQVTRLDWDGVLDESDRQQIKRHKAEALGIEERLHSVMQRVGPTKAWLRDALAWRFDIAARNKKSAPRKKLSQLSLDIEEAVKFLVETKRPCEPKDVRRLLKLNGSQIGRSSTQAFGKKVREAKKRLSATLAPQR